MPTTSDTSSQEVDGVPELPTAEAIADSLEPHVHTHIPSNIHDNSNVAPPSPLVPAKPYQNRNRKNSSASHVAIDHFDPQGVLELRRTLSHQSAANLQRSTSHVPPLPRIDQKIEVKGTSPRSGLTAIDPFSEEKFNLENILKYVVKK